MAGLLSADGVQELDSSCFVVSDFRVGNWLGRQFRGRCSNPQNPDTPKHSQDERMLRRAVCAQPGAAVATGPCRSIEAHKLKPVLNGLRMSIEEALEAVQSPGVVREQAQNHLSVFRTNGIARCMSCVVAVSVDHLAIWQANVVHALRSSAVEALKLCAVRVAVQSLDHCLTDLLDILPLFVASNRHLRCPPI